MLLYIEHIMTVTIGLRKVYNNILNNNDYFNSYMKVI